MDYLEDIIDLVKRNMVSICAILFGVVVSIGSLVYVNVSLSDREECETCEVCESSIEVEDVESSSKEKMISVDVKGAVKKSGVYELPQGSNIQAAIIAAGGLTSKASTTNINLSKKLTDEMVIYVFTKDELKKKETTNEVVCEIPKCECETVTVTECPTVNGSESTDKKGDTTPSNDDKKDDTSKISINKATIDELQKLDGIGESKAKTIVDYREKNGPFERIEDIMNVSGIGSALYEKIKDRLIL